MVSINRTTRSTSQNRSSSNPNVSSSPRWWRFRSNSRSQPLIHQQQEQPIENENYSANKLERMLNFISSYLPTVSVSTRKAILCIIALVLAWKVILWVLELVITGVVFLLVVMVLLFFLRPDFALYVLGQVLPPYFAKAKEIWSHFFVNAGRIFSVTQPSNTNAIEGPPTTPRSPRTITLRPQYDNNLVETAA